MPNNLPAPFLFWDVDVNQLNKSKHKRFIIERVLEKGRPESVSWLGRLYSKQEIANVLASSTNISRKTAYLWSALLDVPQEKVKCLQPPYRPKLSSF